MVIIAFFLLQAILSMATAFTVPNDRADGFYSAAYDANGQEVHTLITLAISRREAPSAAADVFERLVVRDGKIAKRAAESRCKCDSKLDQGNTRDAVADLRTQVGNGVYINPTLFYYSIRGNVIAFVCNGDGSSQLKVWTDIINQSAAQITQSCGQYVTGSVGGPSAYTVGYMASGGSFCDSQLSLPVDHC
jgi:hypothetical protein